MITPFDVFLVFVWAAFFLVGYLTRPRAAAQHQYRCRHRIEIDGQAVDTEVEFRTHAELQRYLVRRGVYGGLTDDQATQLINEAE